MVFGNKEKIYKNIQIPLILMKYNQEILAHIHSEISFFYVNLSKMNCKMGAYAL